MTARIEPHRCHAIGCATVIESFKLMCREHWAKVPPALQTAVWASYRPGQEHDKRPSSEYLEAARLAIAAVATVGDDQLRIPGF
jgi:hypothetical protein